MLRPAFRSWRPMAGWGPWWAAQVAREKVALRQHGRRWLGLLLGLLALHQVMGWSWVPHLSLPYPLWLDVKVVMGEVERGDYVTLTLPPAVASRFPAGATFIKEVVGVAGDQVVAQGREYWVVHSDDSKTPLGLAKSLDRRGQPLEAGPTGLVPAGWYVVRGSNPDSLDSRYAILGWVPRTRIVARSYPILPAWSAEAWVSLGLSRR